MSFRFDDSILPPDPEGLEPLHDREHRIRAFRLDNDHLLLRGGIRDQKPFDLYVADDPEPLTVHHMTVDLVLSFPELEITKIDVAFHDFPGELCDKITDHFQNMVGLSIARGFSRHLRDLFGGPRGCTHIVALVTAMAPIAHQSFWSWRAADAKIAGAPRPLGPRTDMDDEWRRVIGSCHVWAADGPDVALREAGQPVGDPVYLKPRLDRIAARKAAEEHTSR